MEYQRSRKCSIEIPQLASAGFYNKGMKQVRQLMIITPLAPLRGEGLGVRGSFEFGNRSLEMKRSQARSTQAIEFARTQRQQSNEFAETVWQWVRNRRILGMKFRREYPIPPFTVDFCCVELKLVLEVDGKSHFTDDGRKLDADRDRFLADLGYLVFRIPGYQVVNESQQAYESIEATVQARKKRLAKQN